MRSRLRYLPVIPELFLQVPSVLYSVLKYHPAIKTVRDKKSSVAAGLPGHPSQDPYGDLTTMPRPATNANLLPGAYFHYS